MIQEIRNNNINNKTYFGKKVSTMKVVEFITACDLDCIDSLNIWQKNYHQITKAMTGTKNKESAELARQCSDKLTNTYSILNDVLLNYGKFIQSMYTPKKLAKWKTEQVKLIGKKQIELPTFLPDKRKIYNDDAHITLKYCYDEEDLFSDMNVYDAISFLIKSEK